MSGVFVVVDGFEGTGKSTAVMRLKDRLEKEGYKVITVRQPGGTPIAEDLRGVLKRKYEGEVFDPLSEAFVFYAARNQLMTQVVAPALKEGHIVIADRHDMSTDAYQGREYAHLATMVSIKPDITIFMTRPFEMCIETMGARGDDCRIESKDIEELRQIHANYENLATGFHTYGNLITCRFEEFDSPVQQTCEARYINEIIHLAKNANAKVTPTEFEKQVYAITGIKIIVKLDANSKIPSYTRTYPAELTTRDGAMKHFTELLGSGNFVLAHMPLLSIS